MLQFEMKNIRPNLLRLLFKLKLYCMPQYHSENTRLCSVSKIQCQDDDIYSEAKLKTSSIVAGISELGLYASDTKIRV